jgi:DNA helicase HerA-like ATPase
LPHNYHPDTIRGVRTRLKAIKRQPVFSEKGIPIKDLFSPGQISILLLRDLDHNLRALLVGVLVKKIMSLRGKSHNFERLAISQKRRQQGFLERKDEKKAREAQEKYNLYVQEQQKGLSRGWIIIDEAHNYLPTKDIVPSAEPLRQYVNEGRNLGLSIVVATQNPSALDPSIRRNSDILIVHSMSMRDDIAVAEGMLNTRLPDTFKFGREEVSSRVFEQLVRSLPIGYAVISNEVASRIFVVKMRPRITIHGGAEY